MFSSSLSMAIRNGRSVVSIRRNQVVSMENSDGNELDLFQTHVAERLLSLYDGDGAQVDSETMVLEEHRENKKARPHFLLTIAFLRHLMDFFLSCDDEFRALVSLFLSRKSTPISKAERIVWEYLDRSIRSLDICNAVTQSLDSLCHAQRYAAIAADALLAQNPIGEGHFNRAKSALGKFLAAISERSTERAWSLGRNRKGFTAAAAATPQCPKRTLSLSVSKNWSAAEQVQAMAAVLHPPRGGEGSALALAFYTMSSIQVFVMWVLVAAFPAQEPCSTPGFPVLPRQLPWAEVISTLQERVVEEWKKGEKKGGATVMPSGMMAEIQELEGCGKKLVERGEALEFPVKEGQEVEVTATAREMAEACRSMDEGAGALQRKLREVFHRIVRSRAELMELRVQGSRISASLGLL